MSQLYDTDVSYREEQRFHPVIPWMIGIVSPIVTVAVLYYAFFLQAPKSPTVPVGCRIGLIALVVAGDLGVAAYLGLKRMVTEVRYDSLRVSFRPFANRLMPFSEIVRYEPRSSNPLVEFGGWGVKRGKGGTAYLLRGNRGLQLELTSGEKVFIGSQKPEELAKAIKARR